jgi:hypothetical protein|uniref:Uncharacterized protein n=2 Tax=Picea TaxID=3328 RepID=A0A124GNL1_PICGL|nr:hypothetical protein ABT39_MTgene3696 [Picea glauca]QHR90315.1 hypothetical protein Q903MT_gene4338 [Picea sitchensis]
MFLFFKFVTTNLSSDNQQQTYSSYFKSSPNQIGPVVFYVTRANMYLHTTNISCGSGYLFNS